MGELEREYFDVSLTRVPVWRARDGKEGDLYTIHIRSETELYIPPSIMLEEAKAFEERVMQRYLEYKEQCRA